MIIINIPDNNIPERKYIIEIIFNEFLGLQYYLYIKKQRDYEIIIENGNRIIIQDNFFSRFKKDNEYLNINNIPDKLKLLINDFTSKKIIPIIYGNNRIIIKNNNSKIIYCDFDIFASSFFMLTRWEEHVNPQRDIHNRFPLYASLAFKNNFIERPIVNEYIDLLWDLMSYLGIKQQKKKRKFKLVLTHDIDYHLRWNHFSHLLKCVIGDLFIRKKVKYASRNISDYINTILKKKNDPYDTFDFLMDISEKLNIKSHFFFISGGITKFDKHYKINDAFILNLFQKINNRGHIIGFHPSYKTYNDKNLWEKEYNSLQSLSSQEIICGRQHFLRFEVPKTWQIWNDHNMKWESSLYYSNSPGFRCGTCYEYSVFNIITRKKLKLKEKPLTLMEVSITDYKMNTTQQEYKEQVFKLLNLVKKHDGQFVLLWHNSSFNVPFWSKYKEIYKDVLFNY